MKKRFELGFRLACYWWKRSDLEAQPTNIERVAEILTDAGIKVYEVRSSPGDDSQLVCEPRPLGIREALTGELWVPVRTGCDDYPPEEPGSVLAFLAGRRGYSSSFHMDNATMVIQLVIEGEEKFSGLRKNLLQAVDDWFQSLEDALKEAGRQKRKADEAPPAAAG